MSVVMGIETACLCVTVVNAAFSLIGWPYSGNPVIVLSAVVVCAVSFLFCLAMEKDMR